MATTVDRQVLFEGPTVIIVKVTAVGDEDSLANVVLNTSDLTSADAGRGAVGDSYGVLLEATWSINPIFDHVKLYYTDEGNDEVILFMSGDGSYNARGFGGGTVDIEAATITEDDYDVEIDFEESGDEDANGSADITMVFKKRLTHL